jgi:hypothetical protein
VRRTPAGTKEVDVTVPYIIDSGPSPRGWSYYSTFLRCPMLFFWKYVYADAKRLGFNDTTGPLARGTLFHVGRAHLDAQQWARENGKREDAILGPIEAMRVCAERIGEWGREKIGVAESMFHAYRQRYPFESFRIVAVEELAEIHFGSALYTARMDRVCREPNGRVYVHDTKTTVRLDGGTARKYTNHGQFFGHFYLGRKVYGDAFGGVIVDMIDEQGNCVRKPMEPAPFMLRRFPTLIEFAAERIDKMIATWGTDPESWAMFANPDEQTCFGKYGQCSCLELCRWGAKS